MKPHGGTTGEQSATDEELLRQLEGGDTAALGVLYDRYGRLVYGLTLRILASQPEAEDLTQEVFVWLAESSSYDPRRGSLSAYLVTLARSRAIDRLRARGRSSRLLARWAAPAAAADSYDPLHKLSLDEVSARVRAALAQLPADHRRVLELAYFEDLSQPEIAERLNTPLGTVKSWARRGLIGLKTELADLVK